VAIIKKQLLPDYWQEKKQLLRGAEVLYCWKPGGKLVFWVTAPQLMPELDLLQAHFYGE
jgi:hypothetical protein